MVKLNYIFSRKLQQIAQNTENYDIYDADTAVNLMDWHSNGKADPDQYQNDADSQHWFSQRNPKITKYRYTIHVWRYSTLHPQIFHPLLFHLA
jgi:uncharacterized protein YfbU (UPF0304 family)